MGIDLIFGNPGQSEAEWQEDLDLAVTFLPDHVSAYALTPEPGTPIHAAIGGGEIALPDDDAVARMYDGGAGNLAGRGVPPLRDLQLLPGRGRSAATT